MNNKILISMVFCILQISALLGQDNFKDTYAGTLSHDYVNASQLAKLDFIVARKKGNSLELSAVLKIYLGDFKSKEYITYHFSNIEYDLLNGLLYFNDPGQDLTLKTASFKGGELRANVYSAISGKIGTLNLSQNNSSILVKRSLIRPLWGLYEGSCSGEKSRLYLYSYKSSQDTHRLGNPYGAYRLFGYVSKLGGACGQENEWCNTNSIVGAQYNFYEQVLNLRGQTYNLSCDIDENQITCDECIFNRVSKDPVKNKSEYRVERNQSVNKSLNDLVVMSSAINDGEIEGNYKGYLYHNDLKQYQKMTLSLIAFQKKKDGGTGTALYLSLTANLIFGDYRSQERITYKFPDQEYILLNKKMTFTDLEGNSNATLQVEAFSDGLVKGTWFSSIYGKVGSFIVSKTNSLKEVKEGPFFSKLENKYESDTIDLTFSVINKSSPFKNENPFSPLTITGKSWYKAGFARRKLITDSSFDFFTGRIGLELDNGQQFMIGERLENGEFVFRTRNTLFGTRVNHFEPDSFKVKNTKAF